MKNKKPTFELWEVLVIALVTSLIMSITTGYTVYNNKRNINCAAVNDNQYIGEFINSYNSLLSNYYAEIDQNALIDAAIKGMFTYVDDPYTTYMDETSGDSLVDSLKGTYEGIGIVVTINENAGLEVMSVFEDSPAEKAGILVHDIIKTINNIDVAEKTSEEAVAIIKSSADKDVTITVERNQEILTFTVKKATLFVPAVTSEIFESNNQKVGYLSVSKFSESVGEQFKNKLKKLETSGINSLIIDLRDNTGGYLKGATDIASMFLKNGQIVYSLKNKLETNKIKDETDESRNLKVYILINKSSASASEVLAAALKYNNKATLIGVTSYGKGKVQQTSSLSDGSMLKYTTAEWLTPNGNCIDGVGLTPDIQVELSEAYAENMIPENDNQLQMAIYEISK